MTLVRIRARVALTAVLIGMSGASLFFGQDPDSCREAYLQSGAAAQQVGFDEFRRFYSNTLCAPDGESLAAAHADRASGGTR